MSWSTVLPQRLRYYIGDITQPYKYSDDDLAFYIAIAAISVDSQVNLGVDFTIDTSVPSIEPDPMDVDPGIGNLFVLYAAVILTRSEVRRNVSRYGIKIKDDLTSYDGTSALQFSAETLKAFNDVWADAIWQWSLDNRAAVRVIFGGGVGGDDINGISVFESPLR